MPPKYKIKLHKKVITEDSKRFDTAAKKKIKQKLIELLSYHPEEVGEALQFELKGYRKLKIFNDYRVIYRVHRQEVTVFILAVGIRRGSEVYEEAVKRMKRADD